MKTKGFPQSSSKKIKSLIDSGFVMMGDWADLPLDLLALIAKRIDLYEDFVAFGGVCPSWRSVAVKENFNPSAVIPWLMLPEVKSVKQEGSRNLVQGFVSLTKVGMVRKVEFPEARGRRFISSSVGWLITTIDGADEMELLHPLTGVRIPLPHPRTCKDYKKEMPVHKAVLSASPSVTKDYALMVLLGLYSVGFWKPANNIWTVIEPHPSCCIDDVVYYKDQFYAMNNIGHLLCNLNSGTLQIVGEIPSYAIAAGNEKYKLVDGGSELLVVSTTRKTSSVLGLGDNYCYNETDTRFRVFKFDTTNVKPYHGQEISDFGGRSIFVDCTAGTVVAASDAAGTKPNCIYFGDCFVNRRYVKINPSSVKKNTGIYRWGCRTKIHSLDYDTPPIWVIPSF